MIEHIIFQIIFLNITFKVFLYLVFDKYYIFGGVIPDDILQPYILLTLSCQTKVKLSDILRALFTMTHSHEGL